MSNAIDYVLYPDGVYRPAPPLLPPAPRSWAVLGPVSLGASVLGVILTLTVLAPLLSLAVSIVAVVKIDQATHRGKGLAVTGLVLSGAAVLGVLTVIGGLAWFATAHY